MLYMSTCYTQIITVYIIDYNQCFLFNNQIKDGIEILLPNNNNNN